MNGALLGLLGIIALTLAYRFYATFISEKIFALAACDAAGIPTPAHKLEDGIDYVPTKPDILIGHHFSSIAGAAPIVGPAVAAIWGWLPAMIWIVVGVIFMGASHDFGTLVVSMNYEGNSMAIVAEKLIGARARNLFLVIMFFLIWMVIAVFALVIANLFVSFPSSVLPINFEIVVALLMGFFINRGKGSLTLPSIAAQVTLFFMIYLGTKFPLSFAPIFGDNQLMLWMILLLAYSFIASVLPVWVLLQPRDYINGHQLVVGLFLIITGLFIVRPEVVAPAINSHPVGAPPWFPFLFITIACGAISGFHGLVSGGTTSKQVNKWSDAKPVAYGAMLGEGLLALLATLAVTAGFDSLESWHGHYANWNAANGLSAKIGAFVTGSAKFIHGLGLPIPIGETVMAVMVISFAATSLDTACRIQRYIIGEFGVTLKVKTLENRYVGSFLAVFTAFLLMISSDGGKGGLAIWPLFGATNQMLAACNLILIALFVFKTKSKKFGLPYIIPAIFLLIITFVGLVYNVNLFYNKHNMFLVSLAVLLTVIQIWIIIEAMMLAKKYKKF